jgi:hypothetical protein
MKQENILQLAADLKKLVEQRVRLKDKFDKAWERQQSVERELIDLSKRITEQKNALLNAASGTVSPVGDL